jgi:hypothetical protein
LTQILINKEVQLDTFNPPEIPSAMPAGLKPYKDRHRKQRRKILENTKTTAMTKMPLMARIPKQNLYNATIITSIAIDYQNAD